MPIWSAEVKELERLYESFKGRFPELEKELGHLIKTDDENVVLLYSRRCLEVIITDLCESELNRPRKTEPLKGIIDKLQHDEKIPSHIITSMHNLNSLSTYGAHPKDFDPEQVKPVLNNLDIIIKWYLKYKDSKINITGKSEKAKDETIVSDDTAEKIQRPKKRQIVLLSGFTLIVVTILLALLVFNVIGSGNQIKELEKSIAVLPFRNESTDQENSAFVNGLMEKILNNLQLIKDFRVISRTSVEQYRNQSKSVPEIAKELGVNYIVEGSAQKYGNAFSLSVQLIKADKKEDHLWGASFEQEIKEVDDILNIQSEIAEAIAKELEANITTEEKQLIEKISTRNLTALDFYQTGREEHWKYQTDPQNLTALNKAEDLYKKALQYDPTFAQAYVGLANVYWNKNYVAEYLSENFMDSALVLANTALSYDNDLADAYVLRGNYYHEKGYSEQALEEFDKALDINSNLWRAYMVRANTYWNVDMLKCIDNLHKAISINRGRELPYLYGAMASACFDAGFHVISEKYLRMRLTLDNDSVAYFTGMGANAATLEESIRYYKKAYLLDSLNMECLFQLGQRYGVNGQYKESLLILEKWIDQLDKTLVASFRYNGMLRVGYAYWKNNMFEMANYYFDLQMKYSNGQINSTKPWAQQYYSNYDRAAVYAFRGEKTKAYEDLRIVNKPIRMPFWIVQLISVDPLFESIRNETEFQQIVRDIETKYQEEYERVKKWLEEQGMI
jgi:TolB-like protein